MAEASSLTVKSVTLFKHGVSFFTLKGKIKGTSTISLEFKKNEMNDVLKSLLVLDMGGGFVSSIAYDADQDIGKVLQNVAVDIASSGSFTSLVENFKGALTQLDLDGNEVITGRIMGIQEYTAIVNEHEVTRPALVVLDTKGNVGQIKFSDIKGIKLADPKLQKDLDFYLDTIIAGKKADAKRIFIHCEGEGESEREILASYIIESPVWKTSYRMLIPEDPKEEKCFLSGWCLVENTTEQDWDEIDIAMVAGMPVSFVCPIYPPTYIARPVVEPPRAAQIGPAAIEDEVGDEARFEEATKKKMAEEPRKAKTRPPGAAPPPMRAMAGAVAPAMCAPGAPAPASMQVAMKQVAAQTQAQVSTKNMGELFEYRISKPVTIKRKQSALVPIVSKDIKGKRVLLYEQSQHEKNPMACLEITNTAGVTLEQGPITIFYQDNLAGEAMLPFLNQEETRLLSYALEQGVIVDKEKESKSESVHRVSFGGGYSYEYFYTTMKTTYKIQNKTDKAHALYIDHPKTAGYEIYDTKLVPKDTPNHNRFTMSLEPKQNIKLVVNERCESYSSYYIWDMNKKTLLENVQWYLSKEWIKPAEQALLTQVAEVLEKLNEAKNVLSKRQAELNEIFQEQDRLRKNLSSMSKTPSRSEIELREKYVSKLDAQESRLEEIQAEIKSLQKQSDDLSAQVTKLLKELEDTARGA
ncbi:MAG: hypothetical protein Q6373_009880 [Candidatus Sigynarchaeota archaeon]